MTGFTPKVATAHEDKLLCRLFGHKWKNYTIKMTINTQVIVTYKVADGCLKPTTLSNVSNLQLSQCGRCGYQYNPPNSVVN